MGFVFKNVCSDSDLTKCMAFGSDDKVTKIPVEDLKEVFSSQNCILQIHKYNLDHWSFRTGGRTKYATAPRLSSKMNRLPLGRERVGPFSFLPYLCPLVRPLVEGAANRWCRGLPLCPVSPSPHMHCFTIVESSEYGWIRLIRATPSSSSLPTPYCLLSGDERDS